MRLLDLVSRSRRPTPWSEGENIPWNDPGFSRRMLLEHLSQEHDLASRRKEVIDRQVAWIHQVLLGDQPGRVLDLGCGPGLYTTRLARLGHACTGIDWSPASIRHARETAAQGDLAITYVLEDIRTTAAPAEQDLVMLLYGEFSVFKPADIRLVLKRAYQALKPGGWLLLEPHTVEGIKQGAGEQRWWATPGGLFSDRPHLGLNESFWDEENQSKTDRWYTVDVETGQITRYASSYQAYNRQQYEQVLADTGFTQVAFRDSLSEVHPQDGLQVITARKPQ